MASSKPRRTRGNVTWLPSGSARVSVYGGVDQVTGKQIRLRETVPARATKRETEREADKAVTRLLNQVDERRSPRTEATVNQLIDRWLDVIEVERKTRAGYVGKIEKHIRPTIGRLQVGRVTAETLDTLYARLRRCRDHCHGEKYIQHRTTAEHVCDEHSTRRKCVKIATGDLDAKCKWCSRICRQHVCTPLSAGSVRVVHAILSGAFQRAIRWGWIATSPVDQVDPPSVPRPNPNPPTAEEAAQIMQAAESDPDWSALIWLTMTTGARRGEICGLRWPDVDLERGVVVFRSSIGQIAGDVWEKDTKTHQHRRVTIDPELVLVLMAHRERCEARAAELDTTVRRDGFVFSPAIDGAVQLNPDTVTQRYGRMVKRLGITTHLHCLRHYSATELIAAGVDIRTVAGRLGHAGGGSTTLRTYTAFVLESEQRSAAALASRRPFSARKK
ncbi:integrase [Pseudonocardia sp. HH130630-07]|nr:integrase [Pseudonocardia sp. HH130630-07]